ncbi:hypothetical protein AURDEDRAFT_183807 [Auricularia subglabra TFB-10046 SS5]|nr:hypothetical protein AURDEDRAFT_183807 [Auricularia subglabra TFB-10046 SS5]
MNTVFSQYGDPNDTSDPTVVRPKQRRKRDVLACAECRRLKLKCDKTWPCKTCVRRGCSAICPMGSMAPGKAGRMIVANTEELHARIATLCTRIRDLEDALESVAGSGHPQLADTLRQLKAPLCADGSAPCDQAQNGHGDSQHASCSKSSSNETSPQPTEELLQLGRHFPQPIDEEDLIDAAKTIQDIKGLLPTWERGGELVASFYMGFGSTFLMIPQAAFEAIMKEAYELAPGRTDIDGVHKLALVFLTFAMASFHNSQIGDETSEPETYYQLAQSLYCIRSVIESTNDVTVLGLTILAVYVRITNRSTSSWTLLGIVTKLVLGNNLHREPTRLGFTGEVAALKRTLFWEIYSYDILYSFISMRPPLYNMAFIDCPYPDVDLKSSDKATRVAANCDLWKWRYTAEVIPKLMEEVFGCKTPTYAKVLEMDKMVRTSWLPECLKADRQNPATVHDGLRSAAIQRFTVLWFKELALMYLHRNLLAIALTEGRADPLQHRYSPSLLAAFRSAVKLSTSLRALVSEPGQAGQHICFFSHGFAAVTVLGSIAVLAPQTPFGQVAGTEVLAVTDIYDASSMPMPSKIRPWLKLLKERIQQERAGVVLPPLPLQPLCAPDWEEFGDSDRLISTRALKTHVRKDKEGTPTTTRLCDTQETAPTNGGMLYPDFFALNLTDPQSNTFMNEPIAVSFFPPTTGDITLDTLPPQQTVLPVETFALPPPQPPLELNVAGYAASQPTTNDSEINVQWERFLSSIGLSSTNMSTSGYS